MSELERRAALDRQRAIDVQLAIDRDGAAFRDRAGETFSVPRGDAGKSATGSRFTISAPDCTVGSAVPAAAGFAAWSVALPEPPAGSVDFWTSDDDLAAAARGEGMRATLI